MAPDSVIFHIRMEGVAPSYESSKSIDALLGIATDLCRNNEGIEQLAQGVWLIDLKTSLPLLNRLGHEATDRQIAWRTVFFDKPLDWVSFGDWS